MSVGELALRLAQALAWPVVALTAVVIVYRALPRDQREKEKTREDQDEGQG